MTDKSLPEAAAETPELQDEAAQEPSEPEQDVKEEAEQGESEEEAEGEKPEDSESTEEKPKEELSEVERQRHGMQRRIDRQTAKISNMEKVNAELRAKLQAYEQVKAKAEDKAPREEDFDTYEDYHTALVEYEAKQKADAIIEKERSAEREKRQQALMAEKAKALAEKEAGFRKSAPDYDDAKQELREVVNHAMENGGNVDTLDAMADIFAESDNAPALIYELGSKPELVEELMAMEPMKAARRIWAIEQKLAAPKPPPKKEKLPEPIKTAGSPSAGRKALGSMSGREIVSWLNK